MILYKGNKKSNFEELKAEIYIKIVNAQKDTELLKEIKEVISYYEDFNN